MSSKITYIIIYTRIYINVTAGHTENTAGLKIISDLLVYNIVYIFYFI